MYQVSDQPDVVRFAAAAGCVIIHRDEVPSEAFDILVEVSTKNSKSSFILLIYFTFKNIVRIWNHLSWCDRGFPIDLSFFLLCCGKGNQHTRVCPFVVLGKS